MIKLDKLDKPDLLKNHEEEWKESYMTLLSSGELIPMSLKRRYGEKDIKDIIRLETHNKCAYCESIVSHVCPGDIEHILPKKYRPDLVFEWSNLTLACEECNRTRKSDYYNPMEPLINPYIDDPSNHLIAAGPYIFHKAGDKKGELTEKILGINRVELIERRVDRLYQLRNLLDKWANETNISLKKILELELIKEATPDKEFTFIVRKHLQEYCVNIA